MLSFFDWLNIVVVLASLAGFVAFAYSQLSYRAQVRQRLKAAVAGVDSAMTARGALGLRQRSLQLLLALGRRLPMFSATQRNEMRSKLVSAGYRQPNALQILMGSAIVVSVVSVLFVVFVVWPWVGSGNALIKFFSLLLAVYLGLLVPRVVLDKIVARRQLAISNSFPDALDLMLVCANAGLGLNATMLRVAQEMDFLAPELSDEFSLTAAQMQISGDPAKVLTEMAERIGMDSVRSLASTLNQSRQYGTPISEALRVLAVSERTARRMRTEEAAAKLATKMTLPMMLFILPTVMLITGGPAVLSLIESFGAMGR